MSLLIFRKNRNNMENRKRRKVDSIHKKTQESKKLSVVGDHSDSSDGENAGVQPFQDLLSSFAGSSQNLEESSESEDEESFPQEQEASVEIMVEADPDDDRSEVSRKKSIPVFST